MTTLKGLLLGFAGLLLTAPASAQPTFVAPSVPTGPCVHWAYELTATNKLCPKSTLDLSSLQPAAPVQQEAEPYPVVPAAAYPMTGVGSVRVRSHTRCNYSKCWSVRSHWRRR
jgi:hypothetical protein